MNMGDEFHTLAFTPGGTQWIGRWVGLRTGVDTEAEAVHVPIYFHSLTISITAKRLLN
jgi:hypothetical protein